MLPLITLKRQKKLTAGFSDYFTTAAYEGHGGITYSASASTEVGPRGRFFVSANTDKGQIDGYISIGFVNGLEPVYNGERISKNPRIQGALPGYVCLKLTAPNGGGVPASGDEPATCGEIVISGTFGIDGENYFHPIAKFSVNGKVAQCVSSDLLYKAYRKVPKLNWVHTIMAA
jgi:hypothetical protein